MKADILQRSFDFGVKVIGFVRRLPKETVSYVLGRQLVRSGTSIAANIEEAQSGVSRADFSNKMGTALKEARETNLWLRFIQKSELIGENLVAPLLDESEQIKRIFGSIFKRPSPKGEGFDRYRLEAGLGRPPWPTSLYTILKLSSGPSNF